MNLRTLITQQLHNAMLKTGILEECSPLIATGKKPGFGDYQANGAMGAAKKMGTNPRELASQIIQHIETKEHKADALIDKVDIAGPGFINIFLNNAWLESHAGSASQLQQTENPQTVVIDYSSPNLAKEMHVGHLRSTIIGDALARILEGLGHNVIRQNHVGDWGTQFGMLIGELEAQLHEGEQAELALQDLEKFYQQAKKHFDEDPEFADKARQYVVKLQAGDTKILQLWKKFKTISLTHSEEVYQQLNITLKPEDVRGESAYNSDLANVINDLKTANLSQEDQGAQVVFLDELADKKGNPSVCIVQKKDGGYLYSTSDLAALRYRSQILKADRVLVFVDARQSLHLKQVFTIARKANFVSPDIRLEHHAFGTMMGKDGKPFKTRSGGTVKLAELLDEAVERAAKIVKEKNSEISSDDIESVSNKVGIGAVKYADLCKTRTNDYIFDWDEMLNFEGNTSPYLQYAYARIRSLFRNANESYGSFSAPIFLNEKQERSLAIKLLQFNDIVKQIADDAYPHTLCTYLFELASLYMTFYEACPILKDSTDTKIRMSRLMLSKSVGDTLKNGLELLGIEVLEKM